MLIKYSWLKLRKEDQSLNVNVNPLPKHNGRGSTCVNMVEAREKQVVIDVNDVRTPMKVIFEVPMKANVLKTIPPELEMQLHSSNLANRYKYHLGVTGHIIEECAIFKAKI